MRALRTSLLIAVLIAVGVVLCPRTPGPDRIDPQRLLDDLMLARRHYSCTATRIYKSRLFGRETESMTTERILSGGAPIRFGKLVRRNYTPLVEGEDVIAGRQTWVLRLKPLTKKRPWKQLWIDKQTDAILASRDWSCRDRIKRSMKTTHVAYAAVPGDRPAPAPRSHSLTVEQVEKSLSMRIELPRQAPRGFELADVRMVGKRRCAQAVYSDGLYSISLFYEFPGRRGGEQNGMSRIRDWGQGYVVSVAAGRADVTVFADLPAKEMLRIARSVRKAYQERERRLR